MGFCSGIIIWILIDNIYSDVDYYIRVSRYFLIGVGLLLFGGFYLILNVVIGLAIISIGLGWSSLCIGSIAIFLAKSSDDKMIEVENMIFLEAVDDLEKERREFIKILRQQITQRELTTAIETYIWRTKTCVIRATHPNREHIKEDYQKMLSNYFITSLEVLYNARDWTDLVNNVQDNIIESYKEVRNYKRNKHHKRLLKVTSTMGRKKYELEEEFFNRM